MHTGINTMTDAVQELLLIADELGELAERGQQDEIQQPLLRLKRAADEVGMAWSGSWLGYQAYVYYRDYRSPPQETYFSKTGGLARSRGDWVEQSYDKTIEIILTRAENPPTKLANTFREEASSTFEKHKMTLLSIVDLELNSSESSFLSDVREKVVGLSLVTESGLYGDWGPRKTVSRDQRALSRGFQVPPHFSILAKFFVVQHTLATAKNLSELTRYTAGHLLRRKSWDMRATSAGTRVFIGHGRSPVWRELKNFIEDRLALQVDEFSRVSAAGIPNTERLKELMNSAAMAFLILTGEDEQSDGKIRARENVVHEVGLFQGRLGFERAIVLLEEGCEEFSNIEGLGQIRFPKDTVKSAFEDIREVLEREGVLSR